MSGAAAYHTSIRNLTGVPFLDFVTPVKCYLYAYACNRGAKEFEEISTNPKTYPGGFQLFEFCLRDQKRDGLLEIVPPGLSLALP